MGPAAALDEIAQTISELQDSEKLKKLVTELLFQGIPASEVIDKGVRRGLEVVGRRYEEGEYFLSELLYAAELVNGAFDVLKPSLKPGELTKKGVIVLGTVQGDIHDIGKNIFKMLAEAEGFEVHDLGVDVKPESFIEKLRESSAEVLALSALLTTTMEQMRVTVNKLKEAGMRDKVKVLLGGNPVTKEFAREVSADDAALTAPEGVEICKRWITG